VVVHLGVQRPLGERFLQFVEQPVGVECRFRVRSSRMPVFNP
jgi:hypothetical protein